MVGDHMGIPRTVVLFTVFMSFFLHEIAPSSVGVHVNFE
jgi:hypothetical protein